MIWVLFPFVWRVLVHVGLLGFPNLIFNQLVEALFVTGNLVIRDPKAVAFEFAYSWRGFDGTRVFRFNRNGILSLRNHFIGRRIFPITRFEDHVCLIKSNRHCAQSGAEFF